MRYEFRGPNSPKGIDAEVAGSELQRLHEKNGGIRPTDVVTEARPEDAILHPAFEWDDAVAAEEYRIDQARRLVRAVVLVPEPERNENAPVMRAFVSVRRPDGRPQERHYKPLLEVAQNPEEMEQVKRRLRNSLLGLRKQYMNLLEMDESTRNAFELLESAVA